MSSPVLGKDASIKLETDPGSDVFNEIFCGTDLRFTRTPEFIETTSADSGLFTEYKVRLESWAASVTGLTTVENDTTLSFFYLLQTSVRRTKHRIKITFTDADGNSVEINGSVLLGQMDINGPVSGFSEPSLELKGTGAFTVTPVSPPTPVTKEPFADSWATVNGQNYISGASSGEYDGINYILRSDDRILWVDVEGTTYDVVSGTPVTGTRQCKFQTSPSIKIVFPADLVFDGSQVVAVGFERTL